MFLFSSNACDSSWCACKPFQHQHATLHCQPPLHLGSLPSDYIRGANMKLVSGAARISAAAIAVSMTFAIVWSMANLGYPGKVDANLQLAAATHTRAAQ